MTTLKISDGYSITDGPSREELFDALRLFNERRTVTFELLPRETSGRVKFTGRKLRLQAQINKIGVEDGSGHSWCLRVYFKDNQGDGILLVDHDMVDVYYNDGYRKGAIVDARPSSDRVNVDRNGDIWLGSRRIGSVPKRVFS